MVTERRPVVEVLAMAFGERVPASAEPLGDEPAVGVGGVGDQQCTHGNYGTRWRCPHRRFPAQRSTAPPQPGTGSSSTRRSPVSAALSERCGGDIVLKAENLQRTGSFKIRGAMNKLARSGRGPPRRHRRERRQPRAGAGLRGPALRRAVRDLRARRRADRQDRGLPRATARPWSRAAIRSTRRSRPRERAPTKPAWCSATRTTTSTSSPVRPRSARELLDDVADLRRVIVPLGGGGLASGIAIAVKAHDPTVRGDRRAGRGVRPVRPPARSGRARRDAGRRDRREDGRARSPVLSSNSGSTMWSSSRRRRRRRDGAADGAGQAVRRGRRGRGRRRVDVAAGRAGHHGHDVRRVERRQRRPRPAARV